MEALALLRGLHLAALLSVFGTLVFAELAAPPSMRRRLAWHARGGAVAALVLGAAWFAVQAAKFADSWDLGSAVPATLLFTRFGHILAARLLLIAALPFVLAIPRIGLWCATAIAGIALASQGMIGHAGAAEGTTALGLIVSEALHLLAAGAWLGGLPPLLLCLRVLPPHEARRAAERFSPIGITAVLTIAATAVWQSIALIGGLPALIGTAYGRAALAKLGLFGLMFGLAVWNRLSLTDRLAAARARQFMVFSVVTETVCGLAVVLVAGLLASLVPGAHQTVVWPFVWRPSLEAMADADLRGEVALALLAMGAGVGLVAVSWIARRLRLAALAVAAGLIAWQAPSVTLLLVEAYPTSYQTSPTGFTAASISRGQTVFAANCAACHGVGGQGDGPAAAGLRIKPADLTADHLWDHRDGELFWWISYGVESPGSGLAMPGFNAALTDDDRWAAIDFVRTLNAGASLQRSGAWMHPVPAPDLPVACAGGTIDRLSELRGHFVHIVTIAAQGPAPDGAAILRLDRRTGQSPPAIGCVSATASAWGAYAAVAGVAPDALTGWEFLVDPQGWLRAAHAAEAGPDWNNPAVLSDALRALGDQPIDGALGGIHVHGH
jgi:putative copper export protein/mono/diheme cytochrome c family protein